MDVNSLLFICRMDAGSNYNLEIQIIARHTHARWFSLNKVIDVDRTNFVDLVAE
jgi:sulfur transfer complex TusBCD TusB component (DsrH family)